MDKPIFIDNRHRRLSEKLSHSSVFLQAIFDKNKSDLSSLVKRSFQERDVEFSSFLVRIFNFTKLGIEKGLDYPIHDYEVISQSVLHGSVAASSWPALPLTFFIAGAFIQHHIDQPAIDWAPDNMLIWFYTSFIASANNDRFVTSSQRRALAGPSEYPAISLIVRLLWQAANPGSALAGADSILRWFSEECTAPLGKRLLQRIKLAPGWDLSEKSEGGSHNPGRDLEIDGLVDFGQHGNAHKFKLADTWHTGEANFCWGKSPVALFAFTLQERPGPATLDVDLICRGSRPDNVNRVAISSNGLKIYDYFDLQDGYHRVHVDLGSSLRTGRFTNVISFHAPAFRPSHYFGDDNRELGVAVQRLWIRRAA